MNDPRVNRGLQRQLELRREMLAAGQRPLGWKAGFGAAASLERFELGGPLVGFMTDASMIPDGGVANISGWTKAVAEPELAAYLSQDLPAESNEEAARAAITAIGPAIELADIDPPPEDVEQILAGNIFHRGVILGVADTARRGADLTGLEARVRVGGDDMGGTTQLEDLTGRVVAVLAHLSHLLASSGETIRAGEVVICGSVVAPLALSSDISIEFELNPLPAISVMVRKEW